MVLLLLISTVLFVYCTFQSLTPPHTCKPPPRIGRMGSLGMISSIKDILEKVARTLITKEIQVITLSQSAFPYPLKSVINIVKSSPSNSTPAFGRKREREEEKVSNSREHCRHYLRTLNKYFLKFVRRPCYPGSYSHV